MTAEAGDENMILQGEEEKYTQMEPRFWSGKPAGPRQQSGVVTGSLWCKHGPPHHGHGSVQTVKPNGCSRV